MTVNEQHFGKIEELPLVENGGEIPVTNENKLLYIMHYSNYMLNIRTKSQIAAFVRGLRKVIPAEGLSFFFPDEIQLLISGSSNEINIQDLKKYTVMNGWKPEEMPYVDQLWEFLESLPNETREKFVQFSTGTNRPPLLGFQYLTPHFCVAKQANVEGETRYPSSHTCANMFCLPFFGLDQASIDKMKKTVFEAINSTEQGFHMA
jgi:ubiquitin-protein ligase E3 C